MLLDADDSQLVLIDYQEKLMSVIFEGPQVLANAVKLAKLANLMQVPVWGTEQNPSRLGPNAAELRALCDQTLSKMSFSAAEDGLIDWRLPAADVLRLIRAVGEPYPGAFSRQDGNVVHVDEAHVFAEGFRYVGLAGQVQTHTADGFTVMCGDRQCIEITRWRSTNGQRPTVHSKFKMQR